MRKNLILYKCCHIVRVDAEIDKAKLILENRNAIEKHS